MSKMREVMAKAPTVHRTKTIGISRSRGMSSTQSSGRTRVRPNSSFAMSATISMATISKMKVGVVTMSMGPGLMP